MSNNKNWKEVFDVYPDAKEIFVCDGQPFVEKRLADNHSRTINEPVETVARPKAAAKVVKLTKKQQAAADKIAKATAAKVAAKEAADKAAKEAADSTSDEKKTGDQ